MGFAENDFYERLSKKVSVYKLDYDLNVVDSLNLSLEFNLTDSTDLRLVDIAFGEDNYLYALLYLLNDNSPCIGISSHLFRIDTNLQVVKSFDFKSDSLLLEFDDLTIKDDQLVLSGSVIQCRKFFKPYVAYLNLTTDRLVSRIITEADFNQAYVFNSPAIVDDRILLSTSLWFNVINKQQYYSTAVLDTNLNLIDSGMVQDFSWSNNEAAFLRDRGAFIPLSKDSIWKIGPCQSFPDIVWPPPGGDDDYFTFGVSLLDSNYNVTRIDTFPLSGHYHFTNRYPHYDGVQSSLDAYDYHQVDSVLYVEGEKTVAYDNYGTQDSTAFYLYNFNARLGTMNWIKRIQRNTTIGGYAVAALPGNRWALSFNEYNWRKYSGPNLSVHVWILNGSGDIIGQKEYASAEFLPLEVYPNPAVGVLNLKEASAGDGYRIFDLQGKLVLQGTLAEQAQIDVAQLARGNYVLTLEDAYKTYSAKFQKR